MPGRFIIRGKPRIDIGWSLRSSSDAGVWPKPPSTASKTPIVARSRNTRSSASGSAPQRSASSPALTGSPAM
jgi:hypothetical protein